ncbi:hypothetical protein predicted by Glimmer/Critica [Acetobacter senegalensis]|uniref:Uncharacterized protein n=1 Tax=Acetobacter senegalensis TaxID=446692 RepID=A0A0U5B730_9PROT|nr:hypothetical protein predicted by Glimmer/Critica [Acetobacter senegalensis]
MVEPFADCCEGEQLAGTGLKVFMCPESTGPRKENTECDHEDCLRSF